ncbi:MAG: hypothetical protein ABSG21_03715 [Spirochaetia bacterium]
MIGDEDDWLFGANIFKAAQMGVEEEASEHLVETLRYHLGDFEQAVPT